MSFIYRIVEYLVDISEFFYDLMLEVWDWPEPLWRIGYVLYEISDVFNSLAWRFADFAEWLEWAQDEIEDILSWSNIRSLIRDWLYKIEDVLDWWYDWWNFVKAKVEDWYKPKLSAIKDLIETATQGFEELVTAWNNFWNVTWPEWTGKLSELRLLWDTFVNQTLPTLLTFSFLITWWNDKLIEVQTLIDSAVKTWLPFYNEFIALWEDIKLFFSDPLQWCYDKLDEFFERFW